MAFATATSSSLVVATSSVVDLAASGSAFRTAGTPLQHASWTPLRSKCARGRVVAARASLPDDQQQQFPIRREVLASILAAGVVLSSSGPVLADPVLATKRPFDKATNEIQSLASNTNLSRDLARSKAKPVEAKKAVEDAASTLQEKGSQALGEGRKLFGQAPSLTEASSTVKEKGDKAIGEGQNLIGQAPSLTDASSAVKEKGDKAISEGQNLVGQAPSLTNASSTVKEEGDKAISEGQNLVGQATTDFTEARTLPSLFPKSGDELRVKVATETVNPAVDAVTN